MLNALDGYDQKGALSVLSQLAADLTPAPRLEGEPRAVEPVDFKSKNTLEEIRDRLGIARNDYSDEARDKIISFITDQISKIALGSVDEKVILSRLGDKGTLRPDLYEIDYPPEMSFINGRGIRREHIRLALNYPDDVEHVLPEDLPFRENGSFSIYVKHQRYDNPTKDFSLVVVSNRKGYKQSVNDAFRVYPSDVDISRARQPLDILKAFIEKYGYVIKVGNQQGKFFFLVIIETEPEKETFILGVEYPPNAGPFQQLMMLTDTGKTTEVAMAYAVNEDMYKADLKKYRN